MGRESCSASKQSAKSTVQNRLGLYLDRVLEELKKKRTEETQRAKFYSEKAKEVSQDIIDLLFEHNVTFINTLEYPNNLDRLNWYEVCEGEYECRLFLRHFTHPNTCKVGTLYKVLHRKSDSNGPKFNQF